jgi:hypothetical protein
VVPVIVSVERRGGRLLASVYADWFRRDFDVDFVLYGPHLKYSVTEGVLEGVSAVEVLEVDGEDLVKRGLPAERGRKYRVLAVTRW